MKALVRSRFARRINAFLRRSRYGWAWHAVCKTGFIWILVPAAFTLSALGLLALLLVVK
jgi:hypothetical protein